jgi:hypothetical protein
MGRIAGLDNDIEDQAALAGGQVELVPVLNLTTAFEDDVGVRFKQTDQLLARRYRLAIEHPALALGNDARDQRQVTGDLGAPAFGRRCGDLSQPRGSRLEFGSAGLGGGDQFAIEPALFVLPAAVLDCTGPLLGQAPAVAPCDRQRSRQGVGPTQQPRHHSHRVA